MFLCRESPWSGCRDPEWSTSSHFSWGQWSIGCRINPVSLPNDISMVESLLWNFASGSCSQGTCSLNLLSLPAYQMDVSLFTTIIKHLSIKGVLKRQGNCGEKPRDRGNGSFSKKVCARDGTGNILLWPVDNGILGQLWCSHLSWAVPIQTTLRLSVKMSGSVQLWCCWSCRNLGLLDNRQQIGQWRSNCLCLLWPQSAYAFSKTAKWRPAGGDQLFL